MRRANLPLPISNVIVPLPTGEVSASAKPAETSWWLVTNEWTLNTYVPEVAPSLAEAINTFSLLLVALAA